MKIKKLIFMIIFILKLEVAYSSQGQSQAYSDHLAVINQSKKYSIVKSIPLLTWDLTTLYKKYVRQNSQNGDKYIIFMENSITDWATEKNKNYLKEIFDIENYMIGQLLKYLPDFYGGDSEIPRNVNMHNGLGTSSQADCQIVRYLHPLYFLKYHAPQNRKVVVDIGSGWGTCSKLMAHLGYKVYSVDMDEKHLEYQKDHFCDKPNEETFLYLFWKKNNPELLKENNFLSHCRKAKNNIEYIHGDFSDQETVSKLKDKKWDIVIATDSFQFMKTDQKENVLNTIQKQLKPEGSLVLTTNHDVESYNSAYPPFKPIAYDFSLEEIYDQHFDNFKILTLWIDGKQRLNGYTLKRP